MAIVNRDGDVSEQKEWLTWSSTSSYGASGFGAVAVGLTLRLFGPMPFPYQLVGADAVSIGASGAPELAIRILRVVAGGGITMIAAGISNLVIRGGASYAALTSYSGLAASGSTLLLGQRGDILCATTVGANTASTELMVQMVVKKTQDIVSHNGSSS